MLQGNGKNYEPLQHTKVAAPLNVLLINYNGNTPGPAKRLA